MFRFFLFIFSFLLEGVSLLHSDTLPRSALEEVISFCPADVHLAGFFSGLGKDWSDFSKGRVGRHFSSWEKGRPLVRRFQETVRGLETVGLGAEALATLFGGRTGFFLFNEDTDDPDHVFLFAVADAPGFFTDLSSTLALFAAIQGGPGVRKESWSGVPVLSLTDSLHIASDSRLFAVGRNPASLKRVLASPDNPAASLFQDTLFRSLLSNAPAGARHYLFVKTPGLLAGMVPPDVKSLLLAGSLGREIRLRAVLHTEASGGGLAGGLDRSAIPANALGYIPSASLYARGLALRPDGFPEGEALARMLPFREGLLKRNISAYSSFFRTPIMTNCLSAAVFCRPYDTSTNYAFIFRVKGGRSAEDYAKAFWPERSLRNGWYEKKPVVYYTENPGEDGFNYLALEGDVLVVADAFRPLAASLSARMTGRNLASSDTYRSARSPAGSPFFVFQTSVWANRLWGNEVAELARSAAEMSSLLWFTASPLKTHGDGITIDMGNVPGPSRR